MLGFSKEFSIFKYKFTINKAKVMEFYRVYFRTLKTIT